MTIKIKAWMIFVAGLPITFIVSSLIEDQLIAGSVLGYYAFFGLIVLGVYHLSDRFSFKRKDDVKKINK